MKPAIVILLTTLLLHTQEYPFHKIENFLIRPVSSNIDYPTKGDENLSVVYGNFIYFIDILHPNLTEGTHHFSVPIFRVAPRNDKNVIVKNGVQALDVDIKVLTWHSAYYGYFFAKKNSKLRGYFLEDGMDNQDNGAKGIIFTYDGVRSKSYYWSSPGCAFGKKFSIRDTKTLKEQKDITRLLQPVLSYAEKQADGWPGP